MTLTNCSQLNLHHKTFCCFLTMCRSTVDFISGKESDEALPIELFIRKLVGELSGEQPNARRLVIVGDNASVDLTCRSACKRKPEKASLDQTQNSGGGTRWEVSEQDNCNGRLPLPSVPKRRPSLTDVFEDEINEEV